MFVRMQTEGQEPPSAVQRGSIYIDIFSPGLAIRTKPLIPRLETKEMVCQCTAQRQKRFVKRFVVQCYEAQFPPNTLLNVLVHGWWQRDVRVVGYVSAQPLQNVSYTIQGFQRYLKSLCGCSLKILIFQECR